MTEGLTSNQTSHDFVKKGKEAGAVTLVLFSLHCSLAN